MGLMLAFSSPGAIAVTPSLIPPITLNAGQRLALVVVENRPGPAAEQFRTEFVHNGTPRATELGRQEFLSLRIEETVAGGRAPHAAVWFAWPSQAESDQFRADPIYAERYGPRRAEGWTDMQTFYSDLGESTSIQLDRTKHHTLAMLWLNDPQSFDEYFAATEQLREELGCRIVLKLAARRYDSLQDAGFRPPPHWLILTEWQDHSGPAKYLASETFRRLQQQHDSSIAKIEMYRLGFW